MIKVKVYKKENVIYGFDILGHAGYGEQGKDIICSAISMLAINTINSIDEFTNDDVKLEVIDEESGHISFKIDISKKPYSSDTDVLLRSLELGVISAREQYGKKYIEIKEVQ